MARKMTELQKAERAMSRALNKLYEDSSHIKREGDHLIIPTHMTYPQAVQALQTIINEQEEDAGRLMEFKGHHPDDVLYCFNKAMEDRFSMLMAKSEIVQMFFSQMKIPALHHTIQIGYNETETVPVGNVEVPGLPISMDIQIDEHTKDPMKSRVIIKFEYKRKYEPLIKEIEDMTREYLRTKSLFSNKAIDNRFTFIDPQANTDKIIYTDHEQRALEANLFSVIRDPEGTAEDLKVEVNRTVLLSGPYGCGKSLTALLASKLAIEHGWTFMLVRQGDDFTSSFEFAKKYEPCVLFFEDVDSTVGEERDLHVNKVLDVMDGVLAKNSRVITILTTNQPDQINEAMLRPGRIDCWIQLGEVDVSSIVRLVQAYSEHNLTGELDGATLMTKAQGYTPAFIVEATKRAALYARLRDPDNIEINQDDLLDALIELRPQYQMMMGNGAETDETDVAKVLADAIVENLKTNGGNTTDVTSDALYEATQEVIEDGRAYVMEGE